MDKKEIITLMMNTITDKVTHLQDLISGVRASNTDTKSSMGDKYETSREMLQQEITMLQRQLSEVLEQQEVIQKLTFQNHDKAVLGALVETNAGTFYISSGLGELKYKGVKVMCISAQSPLAKAMMGKGKNESFTINGNIQQIKKVI